MNRPFHDSRLDRRFIDTLYTDAMLLADEARSYFEETGRAEREALDPFTRVAFSCESLKVTTRLMHVIAWLLTRRAVEAGELSAHLATEPSRRLGEAPAFDPTTMEALPDRAVKLMAASATLHRRAAILDAALADDAQAQSGVRSLQDRLAASF